MANLTEAQTEHWSQKETETHEIQLIHASTFGQQLICSEFQKRPFKIFIYYSTHFLRKSYSAKAMRKETMLLQGAIQ